MIESDHRIQSHMTELGSQTNIRIEIKKPLLRAFQSMTSTMSRYSPHINIRLIPGSKNKLFFYGDQNMNYKVMQVFNIDPLQKENLLRVNMIRFFSVHVESKHFVSYLEQILNDNDDLFLEICFSNNLLYFRGEWVSFSLNCYSEDQGVKFSFLKDADKIWQLKMQFIYLDLLKKSCKKQGHMNGGTLIFNTEKFKFFVDSVNQDETDDQNNKAFFKEIDGNAIQVNLSNYQNTIHALTRQNDFNGQFSIGADVAEKFFTMFSGSNGSLFKKEKNKNKDKFSKKKIFENNDVFFYIKSDNFRKERNQDRDETRGKIYMFTFNKLEREETSEEFYFYRDSYIRAIRTSEIFFKEEDFFKNEKKSVKKNKPPASGIIKDNLDLSSFVLESSQNVPHRVTNIKNEMILENIEEEENDRKIKNNNSNYSNHISRSTNILKINISNTGSSNVLNESRKYDMQLKIELPSSEERSNILYKNNPSMLSNNNILNYNLLQRNNSVNNISYGGDCSLNTVNILNDDIGSKMNLNLNQNHKGGINAKIFDNNGINNNFDEKVLFANDINSIGYKQTVNNYMNPPKDFNLYYCGQTIELLSNLKNQNNTIQQTGFNAPFNCPISTLNKIDESSIIIDNNSSSAKEFVSMFPSTNMSSVRNFSNMNTGKIYNNNSSRIMNNNNNQVIPQSVNNVTNHNVSNNIKSDNDSNPFILKPIVRKTKPK